MMHYLWNRQRSRGFTLVEVLVITSIIGVLVGVVTPSISNVREKSRDDKRKAEVGEIQLAMTLQQQAGAPLPDASEGELPVCRSGCDNEVNDAVRNFIGTIEDPRHGDEYYYYYNSATREICATLERRDPDDPTNDYPKYCVELKDVGSFATPTPLSPQGCTVQGVDLEDGDSLILYSTEESNDCSSNSLTIQCSDGEVDSYNSSVYQYTECNPPICSPGTEPLYRGVNRPCPIAGETGDYRVEQSKIVTTYSDCSTNEDEVSWEDTGNVLINDCEASCVPNAGDSCTDYSFPPQSGGNMLECQYGNMTRIQCRVNSTQCYYLASYGAADSGSVIGTCDSYGLIDCSGNCQGYWDN